ncbi:MAG: hypothetical protein M3P97_03150 [Actinomycetota bacterium]|nr:hypothetical protein [Actinomycetota bacterium]
MRSGLRRLGPPAATERAPEPEDEQPEAEQPEAEQPEGKASSPEQPEARGARRHLGALAVVVAFALSRLALATVADLRFEDRPLNDAVQLLDRQQLREHLVESLVNLHIQPPLFNLFIGLGLRAPAHLETPLFHALYLAAGLALALCLYAVLRRAGVPTRGAAGLAILFCCSPGVFLYESWLHYDYLVGLLLVVAVLALQRFASGRRPAQAGWFVAALAAIVLTRSLFHPAWLLVCVVGVVLLGGHDRRRVLAVVSVPVLLVVGLGLQRLATFGTPSFSSGMGVNLARITVFQLPPEVRQALVASGELSPVSMVEPLSPVARYDGLVPPPRRTGVPVLDEELKGTYENPPTNDLFRSNMNALTFLEISERYLEDAGYVLRTYPGVYLQGVRTATELFFRPTSDFFTLAENRARVEPVERFYNRVLLGVVAGGAGEFAIPEARTRYRLGPARTSWTAVVAYGVAVVGGGAFLLRALRRRRARQESVVVCGFLWFTTVYIVLVSNLLEVGENNRFRLYSDPLVLVLVATLVVQWWRARAQSRRTG